MRPIHRRGIAVLVVGLSLAGCTTRAEPSSSPKTSEGVGLRLMGHEPLLGRGMNAGLAVSGGYAYVGNRTDATSPDGGVLIVDVHDPSHPETVGSIEPPPDSAVGQSSRELRVWHERHLLIVMYIGCGSACENASGRSTFRFYDIEGAAATAPRLVATYFPPEEPHEFFLWQDPSDPDRALLYASVLYGDPRIEVIDISDASLGEVRPVGVWQSRFGSGLHSISVSPDGTRAYVSYLTVGLVILDTSEVAAGVVSPAISEITQPSDAARWDSARLHSSVLVPGRPLILTTDEVYGPCPWGWVHMIDVRAEVQPSLISEFRLAHNHEARCDPPPEGVYTSHDPTVTPHLALIGWHSAGLVVLSIENAAEPLLAARFEPEPLTDVRIEDELSGDAPGSMMWSYPVVVDGLIYVVDIRNGLYVLAYDGPYQSEIDDASFIEGNSNLTSV